MASTVPRASPPGNATPRCHSYWVQSPPAQYLTHEGLTAAGSGRHVDHLRSLLQHQRPLPQRDEHVARFEVWLGVKLDAIDSPTVRAPVEQFATSHHRRRLRSESRPGQSRGGPKRAAKQEITETIKCLTWLEEVLKRFSEWEVDYANASRAHTASVRGWARLPVAGTG